MDLELAGTSALVCGASQGLGFAIAEALAREGCRVGLLARNAAKLEAHVADFAQRGLAAVALPADMGNWLSLAAALQRFGTPSILVNNSGGPPPVDVTAVDPNLWRQQFEIMVLNQMRLTEAVLPAMRQARFGRILSVASTSIVEPIPVLAVSNALRAALANWMKTLAGVVARDGVTVNMLLPGSFATARIDIDERPRCRAARRERRAASLPNRRPASPWAATAIRRNSAPSPPSSPAPGPPT